MQTAVLVAVLLGLVCGARSANILMIFPTASYSHQVVYQPIWRELSLRGHNVTVMTTDPLDDPSLTNLTEISWKSSYVDWKKMMQKLNEPLGAFYVMDEFEAMFQKIFDDQLAHPDVKRIIDSQDLSYDLVVVEWLFPGMAAFSHKFNCPLVGLSSLGTLLVGYDWIGNPSHPAYVTDFGLPYTAPLNFWQRCVNVLYNIWSRWYQMYKMTPQMDEIMRKYFGDGFPPLRTIQETVSLVLLNVNPIFHGVRPNVPAIKEMGSVGIHIKPKKPLPEVFKRNFHGLKRNSN